MAKPADFGQGLVSGFNSWTSWVWLFAGLLSGFQETASGYQDEMDDGRNGRLNCAFATVCRMSYAGQSVRQSVLQSFLIFLQLKICSKDFSHAVYAGSLKLPRCCAEDSCSEKIAGICPVTITIMSSCQVVFSNREL